MTKHTFNKMLYTIGGMLLLTNSLNAHFYWPINFKPTNKEYRQLKSSCGPSVPKNTDDVVFGGRDGVFFFQSGIVHSIESDFAGINGKTAYYETFFVKDKAPFKCRKFVAQKITYFGETTNDSIILNTKKGPIEVLLTGKTLPVDVMPRINIPLPELPLQ